MSTETKPELKEYAEGWITERKGTGIPGFLKLGYPIIGIAVLAYTFMYINGEVTHSTRGNLVQQLNAVTGTADVFMFIVAGMVILYLGILARYLFTKQGHEE
jgi:hypothetical protein